MSADVKRARTEAGGTCSDRTMASLSLSQTLLFHIWTYLRTHELVVFASLVCRDWSVQLRPLDRCGTGFWARAADHLEVPHRHPERWSRYMAVERLGLYRHLVLDLARLWSHQPQRDLVFDASPISLAVSSSFTPIPEQANLLRCAPLLKRVRAVTTTTASIQCLWPQDVVAASSTSSSSSSSSSSTTVSSSSSASSSSPASSSPGAAAPAVALGAVSSLHLCLSLDAAGGESEHCLALHLLLRDQALSRDIYANILHRRHLLSATTASKLSYLTTFIAPFCTFAVGSLLDSLPHLTRLTVAAMGPFNDQHAAWRRITDAEIDMRDVRWPSALSRTAPFGACQQRLAIVNTRQLRIVHAASPMTHEMLTLQQRLWDTHEHHLPLRPALLADKKKLERLTREMAAHDARTAPPIRPNTLLRDLTLLPESWHSDSIRETDTAPPAALLLELAAWLPALERLTLSAHWCPRSGSWRQPPPPQSAAAAVRPPLFPCLTHLVLDTQCCFCNQIAHWLPLLREMPALLHLSLAIPVADVDADDDDEPSHYEKVKDVFRTLLQTVAAACPGLKTLRLPDALQWTAPLLGDTSLFPALRLVEFVTFRAVSLFPLPLRPLPQVLASVAGVANTRLAMQTVVV